MYLPLANAISMNWHLPDVEGDGDDAMKLSMPN